MKQREELKVHLYSTNDDVRRTVYTAMGIALVKHKLDLVSRRAMVDNLANSLLIEPSAIHAAAEKYLSYTNTITNDLHSVKRVTGWHVIGTVGHYTDDDLDMLETHKEAFNAGYQYVAKSCSQ